MIYQRIRDLKEDSDIKQKDVAQIIGMSEKQYARYERGETDIPMQAAIKLAKYYNVSLDYIAGLTNDKKGFNKSDLPSSEVDLLKKFRSLSEKQRGIIIGRIEAFTEENAEISEKEERLKGAV